MENNELKTAYLIDIPFGRESEYAVVDFGVSEYAVVVLVDFGCLVFCAVSHTLPGRARHNVLKNMFTEILSCLP